MSWICRGEHPVRVRHVVVVMWWHDAGRRRAHVGPRLGHTLDVHVVVAVAVAMVMIAVAAVVIAGMLHVWRGLVDTRGAVMMFLFLVVIVLVVILLLMLLLVDAIDVIESCWHSPDAVEAAFYTATTRLLL